MSTPLRPEPKRLWLEALRSEEFPQTTGALHDEVGYCCLGVLCEVAIKAGVKIEMGYYDDVGKFVYDNNTDLPPDSVVDWAFGTPAAELAVTVDSEDTDGLTHEEELTELNDSGKWSFIQIADAIDESL